MHGFVFAGLDKSWASSSKTSTDSTKASARPNPGGGFVANENFKRIYCMGRGEDYGIRLNQARMSGQDRSCGRGSMSEPNLIVSFAPGQA
ncbi:hypothetical protein M0657_005635 [Pyricularia oryzae]|nr:hypothetical protein M9X92_009470 [Pyricularia oryzae]KAI7922366.1 hypothetical protein M0657_005635 [Pyricularia oryzae]